MNIRKIFAAGIGRSRRGPNLALAIALLVLLAGGCGTSSSDTDLTEQYPTLGGNLNWDEDDLQAGIEAPLWNSAWAITIDNMGSMTIGARINSAQSTFLASPIFDIGLLAKHNLLDKNTSSSTMAATEIRLLSNKEASEKSGAEAYNFSASGSYGGFKASTAYSQENKRQETTSSGSVEVAMSYNNYGAYIQLLTADFAGPYDYTPYLMGGKLEESEVKRYVDYVEKSAGTSEDTYISALKIKNGGQLPREDANVYGNIQLLGEMLKIFDLLKFQHDKYQGNEDLKKTIIANMRTLKEHITKAIKLFYASHGDAFVTHVNLMNYGLGMGTLMFDTASGTTEDIYHAAASASYSGLSGGGGASADVGAARKMGWATAFKNAQVKAVSKPTGVIDPTSWARSIFDILRDESKPIEVPPLNITTLAKLELPAPVGPRKDLDDPPDSVFQSYDDWLKYVENKKARPKQEQEQAQNAEKQIKEQGVQKALAGNGMQIGPELYDNFIWELWSLNSRRPQTDVIENTNIVRVDDMFVSYFKTTPYDHVIPWLRPNLDIPGEEEKLAGFPNISKLLLAIHHVGALETYIRFLGNLAVSRVNPDMAEQFSNFSKQFESDGFLLIGEHLNQGKDVADKLRASFGVKMFGTNCEAGALYDSLGQSVDYCRYISFLLDPGVVTLWKDAPGGYMPLAWWDGRLSFADLVAYRKLEYETGSWPGPEWIRHNYLWYEFRPYDDPSKNPLAFYGEFNTTLKTPWFAIFQYRQKETPNLLFLERSGASQIVHGNDYVAHVNPDHYRADEWFNKMNPMFGARMTKDFIDVLAKPNNSLLNSALIQGYSLYFPRATQSRDLHEKFRMLVLSHDPEQQRTLKPDQELPRLQSFSGYGANHPRKAYPDKIVFWEPQDKTFGTAWAGSRSPQVVETRTGTVVDLRTYSYPHLKSSQYVILLLPLNRNTCGDKLDRAFTYTNSLGVTDIVWDGSFNPTYKKSLFN